MTQKAYISIWAALVGLAAISIVLGKSGSLHLALTGIFGIAALKAYLVLTYYMHLKTEALYVKIALISGFLGLVILFWALVPDIVIDPRK